jgi:hypothetical protein
MARTVPPLPDAKVIEFAGNSMVPTWRSFWQNFILYVKQTPSGENLAASPSYANDAAAAAGGVAIGGFYRNGSVVQVRVV